MLAATTTTEDRTLRTTRGFSLLELLIVVAIILILATIALPSLLRSRQAANESAAVSALQLLNASENLYMTSTRGFATVAEMVGDGLIDSRFLGVKSGYSYVISLSASRMNYLLTASASTPNAGRYDYYTTPDFVIRYTTTAGRYPAGQAGMPVN